MELKQGIWLAVRYSQFAVVGAAFTWERRSFSINFNRLRGQPSASCVPVPEKIFFIRKYRASLKYRASRSRLLILQLTVEFMNAIGYNEVNDYLIKEMK